MNTKIAAVSPQTKRHSWAWELVRHLLAVAHLSLIPSVCLECFEELEDHLFSAWAVADCLPRSLQTIHTINNIPKNRKTVLVILYLHLKPYSATQKDENASSLLNLWGLRESWLAMAYFAFTSMIYYEKANSHFCKYSQHCTTQAKYKILK